MYDIEREHIFIFQLKILSVDRFFSKTNLLSIESNKAEASVYENLRTEVNLFQNNFPVLHQLLIAQVNIKKQKLWF
jgi:hypothetical protein